MAHGIPYNIRYQRMTFPKSIIVIPAFALVLRLASSPTADLSYLVLAVYALTGRAQAIQALFLSWLFSMFNPGLAPEAINSAIGRYAVMAGAMASVLLRFKLSRGKFRIKHHIAATLLLGVFLIIHSLFVSPIPDVSVLKSISFIVVFTTLLSAWGSLNPHQRMQTEIFVFGGMIAIVLASLPLITSGVGYLRNGTGFQGILSHPQAFGPFVALLGAWLGGRFLSERKLPLWQLGLFALTPILILASEARTAAGAMMLGIALPLVFTLILSRYKTTTLLAGVFTRRFAIAAWAGSIGLAVFGAFLFTQVDFFILKSGRSSGTNLAEALEISRGPLVYTMIDNITENPFGGIGFGIASFPDEMVVKREPFSGLPLGASIEKGVMPVAIMEELGIPGFLLIGGWLVMLVRRASRAGFASLTVITAALAVNLGENIFFSPGGMGLIVMVLATWAATPRKMVPGLAVPLWIR